MVEPICKGVRLTAPFPCGLGLAAFFGGSAAFFGAAFLPFLPAIPTPMAAPAQYWNLITGYNWLTG